MMFLLLFDGSFYTIKNLKIQYSGYSLSVVKWDQNKAT